MSAVINWAPAIDGDKVCQTADYELRFVSSLSYDTPIKGRPGFALIYSPTGHRQAEGVDIVAAVAQTFREQAILDYIKTNPDAIKQGQKQKSLQDFFSDMQADRAN